MTSDATDDRHQLVKRGRHNETPIEAAPIDGYPARTGLTSAG